MRQLTFLATIVQLVTFIWQVVADGDVRLSHDGPVVVGGTITFKAELVDNDGQTPSGKFIYSWEDNGLEPHKYETDGTTNTTTYYSVSYPPPKYRVGVYVMQVVVCKYDFLHIYCGDYASRRIYFRVTNLLNGNITIEQTNKTLQSNFVSSGEVAKLSVDLRSGDYDYLIKTATSIVTYWFIDCQVYNNSVGFKLNHSFTDPNAFHIVEALVVASFDPPTTTTVAPTTTSTTTVAPSNITTTTAPSNTTVLPNNTTTTTTTTITPSTTTVKIPTTSPATSNKTVLVNETFPFVCKSKINAQPNKTYGYFQREIKIRAPITKIVADGSTWIQPWKSLSLAVSCNGTGPFRKCIEIHPGKYNITGNETCDQNVETIDTCKFTFEHFFLDPLDYTVVIIISNEVSTQIQPVAINIYKLTPKPQLSVIVVPVSCSLVAVVLIVFGIAYYVQNRARFTVEVADFDFGQNNPDMEYKTFTERLRDSFNNAVRPGQRQRLIDNETPIYGSMNH